MAKNSIRDYSSTASSNTDVQSVDISEGCPASGINNAIREVMADLKDVSTGAVALESPSADSLTVTGDLTVDTNTLYVDSTNNRVGVGTVSPTKKLSASIGLSDTDGLALEYSGENKGGILLSPTTGEVRMGALNATGTYFPTLYSNNTEAMRIDSSGNVLVGATSSLYGTEKLHVYNTTNVASFWCNTGSDLGALFIRHERASGGTTGEMVSFRASGGGAVGSIRSSGSSTSYNTSSDYRLKENVTADWDATTRLKQLNPVRFNFIADPDTTVDGFLAHEVQDIVPEAISGTKDAVDDEGNPVYQGIDQSKLVPLLVKTIQELEARITALEAN